MLHFLKKIDTSLMRDLFVYSFTTFAIDFVLQ